MGNISNRSDFVLQIKKALAKITIQSKFSLKVEEELEQSEKNNSSNCMIKSWKF